MALELGGKNPNIVFADADWQASVDNALTAVFLHSGQVCSAGARLIVQEQDSAALAQQALNEGIHTLRQAGWLKAMQGITSIEEVMGATVHA